MWKIVKYKTGSLSNGHTKILFGDKEVGEVVSYNLTSRSGDDNEYLEIRVRNPDVIYETQEPKSLYAKISEEDSLSDDKEFVEEIKKRFFD